MPHRLNRPLARELVLKSKPPRTLDTLLSAMEFLNSTRSADEDPEVDALLTDIMSAAISEDAAAIEAVTTHLKHLLQQHGQL